MPPALAMMKIWDLWAQGDRAPLAGLEGRAGSAAASVRILNQYQYAAVCEQGRPLTAALPLLVRPPVGRLGREQGREAAGRADLGTGRLGLALSGVPPMNRPPAMPPFSSMRKGTVGEDGCRGR